MCQKKLKTKQVSAKSRTILIEQMCQLSIFFFFFQHFLVLCFLCLYLCLPSPSGLHALSSILYPLSLLVLFLSCVSHSSSVAFFCSTLSFSTPLSCLFSCPSLTPPPPVCDSSGVCQLNSCAHLPGRKQSDSFGTFEVQEKKGRSFTFLFTLF